MTVAVTGEKLAIIRYALSIIRFLGYWHPSITSALWQQT